MDTEEPWPRSAAATALLLNPRMDWLDVLKLAVKELVVAGSFRLAVTVRRRRWLASTQDVTIRPGEAKARDRPPLRAVEKALHDALPAGALVSGAPLRQVIAEGFTQQPTWARSTWQSAVDDLTWRGLVKSEKRWYGAQVTRTPVGDTWAATAEGQLRQWREALAAGGAEAAVSLPLALGSPGLLLLVGQPALKAIDDELRRGDGTADSSGAVFPAGDSGGDHVWVDELHDIDGLSGLDGAVDGAVDGGSPGGGDGGDGGGGD